MCPVLRFEWDPAKAAANLRKHGVSFEDAQTAFSDEPARVVNKGGRALISVRWTSMRKEYDFSNSRKNPYAARLKRPVTIRLDQESIVYFKSMSEETGIPYQSLINLYLKECAASKKRLNIAWK